jgi:predicted Zn-dependent protease with MMP-like domain
MDATAKWLVKVAREEVQGLMQSLPEGLRERAQGITLVLDPWPSDALVAEGWDDGLLGMFTGQAEGTPWEGPPPLPPQILLFYENLWEFAEENEETYRKEVRVTYLHELGHYLGLDEAEIDERGLL